MKKKNTELQPGVLQDDKSSSRRYNINNRNYCITLNCCLQYEICVQKGKKMQTFSKNVIEYSNCKLNF